MKNDKKIYATPALTREKWRSPRPLQRMLACGAITLVLGLSQYGSASPEGDRYAEDLATRLQAPGSRRETFTSGLDTAALHIEQKVHTKRAEDGTEMHRIAVKSVEKSGKHPPSYMEIIQANGEMWLLYPNVKRAIQVPAALVPSYGEAVNQSAMSYTGGKGLDDDPQADRRLEDVQYGGKVAKRLSITHEESFRAGKAAQLGLDPALVPAKVVLTVDANTHDVLRSTAIAADGSTVYDYAPSSIDSTVQYSDDHFRVPASYRRIYPADDESFRVEQRDVVRLLLLKKRKADTATPVLN